MWSFAPEHSKLKPPLITIIVHFYESDNFILGWSASDKVLTRFFFTFWAIIRCTAAIFTRKNARETDRKKLVKTPGVITNHCRSSVQWHARAKARLCLPLFTVFFTYTGDFSHHYPWLFWQQHSFEGITIWSMKFISSLHGIVLLSKARQWGKNFYEVVFERPFVYPKCDSIKAFIST